MAAEENDLRELRTEMERVVGSGPAATLMRHLPPVEWPDVATKADIKRLEAQVGTIDTGLQVGLLTLENKVLDKLNQQTLTIVIALVTVVVAISSVALFR